jgi:ribonuclease D
MLQGSSTADDSLATAEDVAQAARLAREHGRLGIDTEFMSEGRYRALLCLVQVVVDDPEAEGGRRIIMIDSLNGVDTAPLAELLADPAIEVVLHAGRQDVAILRRVWNTELTNIFDTQIAAGFAGAGAQTGYGNLLGVILGRRVGKTASYTRWDARPLTPEQLAYAAEDVAHLLELCDEIQRRLAASGRLEWAREECRRLEGATDELARRRPRARRLARAHRGRGGPSGQLGARRPADGRAGQTSPLEREGARADPRHPWLHDPPARGDHPRRDRRRPEGATDPPRGDAAAVRAG